MAKQQAHQSVTIPMEWYRQIAKAAKAEGRTIKGQLSLIFAQHFGKKNP